MSLFPSSLQSLKTSIRQGLKQSKAIWQGYAFHYAAQQNLETIASYPYQWSHCTTPIKLRSGLPNINENRLWNMQLAASQMDGLILQPDQVFGFWNRVPKPTLSNGFRAGPTLIRGKLSTAVGGGLCQISTTLFNAFLYANLQILERYNHSIDAHGEGRFFTLGQDAAVAYGYKDLMVRNSGSIPLLLRLQVAVESAEVTASIWGQAPMPVQIQVESTVLEQLSASGAADTPGWKVETVRSIRPASSEPSFPWQTNYRSLDIYHPHVSLHHADSSNPEPISD